MRRLRSLRQQRGQVMVLFAIMIPVFIAIVGLAIDGASVYRARRDMQGAADLAALAGAIDLPADSSAAKVAAQNNAGSNGFLTGVTTTTPYNGESTKIEVSISADVDTFFMGILGVDSVAVSARAVAVHDTATVALFAGKDVCDANNIEAIDWSGSSNIVTGGAHSNSGVKVSGSNNTLDGPLTYVCDHVVSGSGNTFGSGPTQVGTRPWPFTFSISDFMPCTYGSLTDSTWANFDLNADGPWWVGGDSSSEQLKPGVYCGEEKLTLSGADISGNVTFVANEKIQISGSNFDLTAYQHNVLMYSLGSAADAMALSGSDGNWQGILYAPNGQVEVSGSGNLSIDGSIVSWTIKLNGSSFGITGLVDTTRAAQLIE